jgi:ferredoxin-type protein NapH
MGGAELRSDLRAALQALRAVALLTLGPIMVFGQIGVTAVGGLLNCPFSVPFILCPICPTPCTFNLIRPWLFGWIVASGIVLGRAFCGTTCPIGIMSDILYRLPVGKRHLKHGRMLTYLRYSFLALFFWLMVEAALVLTGSRTGGGLWIILTLRRGIFVPIITLAFMALLVTSAFIYRPWCIYLCPVGTLLSKANSFSLLGLERDALVCDDCNACIESCPLGVGNASDPDCMRCLSCFTSCERAAIRLKPRFRSD